MEYATNSAHPTDESKGITRIHLTSAIILAGLVSNPSGDLVPEDNYDAKYDARVAVTLAEALIDVLQDRGLA